MRVMFLSVVVMCGALLAGGCAAFFNQPIVCGGKGQAPCGDPDITKAPSPSAFPSASSSGAPAPSTSTSKGK